MTTAATGLLLCFVLVSHDICMDYWPRLFRQDSWILAKLFCACLWTTMDASSINGVATGQEMVREENSSRSGILF